MSEQVLLKMWYIEEFDSEILWLDDKGGRQGIY